MRIILADHHAQSRWQVKTRLDEVPGLDLVGEAENAQDLLLLVENRPVDLVLIDSDLPGQSMGEVIRCLHSLRPRLVVVVMGSKPESLYKLLKDGANAIVSKGDQPDWLLETLRKFEKAPKTDKEK
jgi:DNA-binding NarL/FixJ family response regulator